MKTENISKNATSNSSNKSTSKNVKVNPNGNTGKQGKAENAVFKAYALHCKEAQKAGEQHGATAYAIQALMLAGKETTKEQKQAYSAFVALVEKAQAACIAVTGKASPCGVFNYLDGRETGYKVARGLGNSISMRRFLEGLITLKNRKARNAPTTAKRIKAKEAESPAMLNDGTSPETMPIPEPMQA